MGATESILSGPEEEDGRLREPQSASSHPAPSSFQPHAAPRPRRRPRPQSATQSSNHACTLQGVVLGLPNSGKHTLLDRLQGKDPFDQHDSTDPPTRDTTASFTAPYQPPNKAWDAKIQLQVGLDFPSDTVDFGVVLVHPHEKRRRFQKHVKQSVHAMMKAQGYQRESLNDDDDDDDDEVVEEPATQQELHGPPRPVCLCILINFRDLLHEDDEDGLSDTIHSITMEVLQEYPALEPDRLVIECGHVSLWNCYGLSLLHSFIYRAYLQRKRSDCDRILQEIHAVKRTVAPVPAMLYTDYVAQMVLPRAPQSTGNGASSHRHPRRNASEERPNAPAVELEDSRPMDGNVVGRRQIIPPHVKDQSNTEQPRADPRANETLLSTSKDALEAFLADNDSEEEKAPKDRVVHESESSSDSDDDGDGTFFYREKPEEEEKEELTEQPYRPSTPERIEPEQDQQQADPSNAESEEPNTSNQSQVPIQETKSMPAEDGTIPSAEEEETHPGAPIDGDHGSADTDAAEIENKEAKDKVSSVDSAALHRDTSSLPAQPIRSAPAPLQGELADDDESSNGGFIVGGSMLNHAADSDEEDFVIESLSPPAEDKPTIVVNGLQAKSKLNDEGKDITTKEAAVTGGFSKEVLAALAAAQLDAEEMAKMPDKRSKKEKKEKKSKKKSRSQ